MKNILIYFLTHFYFAALSLPMFGGASHTDITLPHASLLHETSRTFSNFVCVCFFFLLILGRPSEFADLEVRTFEKRGMTT